MKFRVLGIDPGLAKTGWGLVDTDGNRHRHVDHGLIETQPDQPPERRLLTLYRELSSLVNAYNPAAMGVETLYFVKNISSAMPVAQARGITLLVAAQNDLKLCEFGPATIKQSVTGSGRADKKQVQTLIQLILGMDSIPGSDHSADALAAAITLIHHGILWSTVSTE